MTSDPVSLRRLVLVDGPNDFSNQRWQDYTGISSDGARGWGCQVAVHPDDPRENNS